MKRLIVSADDFGMTDGVCRGIIEAMERGIVTQTGAVVCRPDDAERVVRWKDRVPGALGVHLQLTDGVPCLPAAEVPTLVNEHGAFHRSSAELKGIDAADVEREWLAQWKRARQLGIEPAHFDTHHHVHTSFKLLPAMAAVARDARAGARSGTPQHAQALAQCGVHCADICTIDFFGDGLTEERFLDAVGAAFDAIGGDGTVEVATHPAYADAALAERSYYAAGRQLELRILTESSLRARLEDRGITLATTSSLANHSINPSSTCSRQSVA
jgi:predicted glycoside hydrolase/deacetylase ChbG (UPF0249 family)